MKSRSALFFEQRNELKCRSLDTRPNEPSTMARLRVFIVALPLLILSTVPDVLRKSEVHRCNLLLRVQVMPNFIGT